MKTENTTTLYKRDKAGKVRVWSITPTDTGYTTLTGVENGKMVSQSRTVKVKNVGRSNETNISEQIKLEVSARIAKQIQREDYHQDVELSGKALRPMLAMDYRKHGARMSENVMFQAKLDGLRVLWDGENLTTRKGEVYDIPHIKAVAEENLKDLNEILVAEGLPEAAALDGEIYSHGMPLQKIVSAARKPNSDTKLLHMVVFDAIIPNTPYRQRYDTLRDVQGLLLQPALSAENLNIDNVHDEYVRAGYEGLMLRETNGMYEVGKRSDTLMKYKKFQDIELKINGLSVDRNGNAVYEVDLANGGTVSVTPKATHEVRKEMLKHPEDYIGKWLTIQFQCYTVSGSLQFPIGLGLRDCDDDGNPNI